MIASAQRTDLASRPLDLAALEVFGKRKSGVARFNQVRAELYALTGLASLRPYDGWDDFQARNNVSNELIADLKTAYPEGFEAMDLWVGGLAERHDVGHLASTLDAIVADLLDQDPRAPR